jgi:hypothetical protein
MDTPKPRRRLALLLRGHVRDAFQNDGMHTFVREMQSDVRMHVDVYIQTWDCKEASAGCSWRPLEAQRAPVSAADVKGYFRRCEHRALVLSETSIDLLGDCDGVIPGTLMSKRGWKNMWFGKLSGMRLIESSGVEYDATLSMRLDFFGPYVLSRRVSDYKTLDVTRQYVREWAYSAAGAAQVRFLVDGPAMGIDNCYIGPTALMCGICTAFHTDMDGTCARLGYDVNQEVLVYKLARELNEKNAIVRV